MLERKVSVASTLLTVDARITHEINAGRGVLVQVSLELINLFDDDTYLVYNEARGDGMWINGVNEATRRAGRRIQLGVKLSF